MEAKIVVLLDKAPELLSLEFSGFEGSEKFVAIDRVRLEFQHKRFDVGRDSLNGAHVTHTRNGISPIITIRECRLHDAPGQSQGSRCGVVHGLFFVFSIRYTYHVSFVKILHRDSKFQRSKD